MRNFALPGARAERLIPFCSPRETRGAGEKNGLRLAGYPGLRGRLASTLLMLVLPVVAGLAANGWGVETAEAQVSLGGDAEEAPAEETGPTSPAASPKERVSDVESASEKVRRRASRIGRRDRRARRGASREAQWRHQKIPEAQREKTRVGRWMRAPEERFEMTPEQLAVIEELNAIGYLSGTQEASGFSGVTRHARGKTYDGLNLYTSGHAPSAFVVDMTGRVLHEWHHRFDAVWLEDTKGARQVGAEHWRRVYLYPNGDLLAIHDRLGIIKLDKDSNLLWENRNDAHHDIDLGENGDIYVLTSDAHVVPDVNRRTPTLEDFITVLGPDGKQKQSLSLVQALKNSDFEALWQRAKRRGRDLFHANTVTLLDGAIADDCEPFKKGCVLTSLRNLSTLAVVDLDSESIVWICQDVFKAQHDPTILPNGNLMLFDNTGMRDRSRVIEYQGCSKEIHWEFRGTEDVPFFSRTCGAAQRLPNGNTLITESDGGRVFEVTADQEIVWEYYNPHRSGAENEFIATLFDMVRLAPDFPRDWMRGDAEPEPAQEPAQEQDLEAVGTECPAADSEAATVAEE